MSNWQKPPLGAPPLFGHPLSRGLVGLWLFNEGSGGQVFDLSGNGRNGTLENGVSWDSGSIGSRLSFGGASGECVDCGTKAVDFQSHTIIVRLTPTTIAGDYRSILTRMGPVDVDTDGFMWALTNAGNPAFVFYGTGLRGWYASSLTLSVNTTYSLALVWDRPAAECRFYSNGIYIDSVATTAENINQAASREMRIGQRLKNSLDPYIGKISHLCLYNCALSASEIALLYREPFCMFERDPIELWMGSMEVAPVGNAGIMTTNTGFWGPTF
jgi:hypothetical protein